MTTKCSSCGAETEGSICNFCGSALQAIESADAEAKAIAELHVVIGDTDDDAKRARLLKNGPLPSDVAVLIDAGLRTAQLLDPKRYSDRTPSAALARLDSILMKLRIAAGENDRARRAAEELQERIERYQTAAAKEEREGGVLVGIGCLVLIIIGVIAYGLWKAG